MISLTVYLELVNNSSGVAQNLAESRCDAGRHAAGSERRARRGIASPPTLPKSRCGLIFELKEKWRRLQRSFWLKV